MNRYPRNRYVADLHIHSHYSRATSKDLNLENLAKWAQLKGVQLVATGDIAHPGWLAELRAKLEPAEDGLYRLKAEVSAPIQEEVPAACRAPVRFLLGGEISNIYKRHDQVRKVHNLCFFPTFSALDRFQATLEKIGNIRSDGRPILGLDSRDLLEITLETDDRGYFIPAHIWTPWFAMFGSKSGFDTVEECFGDLTEHIFAVETGLSADPPMCWRVSDLDNYTLVSNSDAHSPPKLAREACIFNTEWSYDALFGALHTGDPEQYLGTLEFFPEEGKYHFDGHRKCGIRWHPQTSIAHGDRCTVCGKPVTVGVMHRVEELADRPEGARPEQTHPFRSIIPLPEILAEVEGVGAGSKRVQAAYVELLGKLGNELYILLDAPLAEIEAAGGSLLAEGVRRMRDDEVNIAGGYDGEFGVIKIFADGERARLSVPQLGLFGAELGVEQIEAAKKTEGTGDREESEGVTATIH
ncbi:MAG: endonuclease Q family protein [Caldilineaceae bacterium]